MNTLCRKKYRKISGVKGTVWEFAVVCYISLLEYNPVLNKWPRSKLDLIHKSEYELKVLAQHLWWKLVTWGKFYARNVNSLLN